MHGLSPLSLGAGLVLLASPVAAQQFIITDVTYTHSGATTSDSHYRVAPLAGSAKNWKSPIDYASGSAHVLLEVKTKPTDTPTKFQICFEGTPSYCCTDQSIAYTKPGIYQWTTQVVKFYYGGDVDFSKGFGKVALILKNTTNGKPQGDPNYVPTDLRVEVAIMAPGVSYMAPMPPVLDAGSPLDASWPLDAGADSAASDTGPNDAANEPLADATVAPAVDAGGGAALDSSSPGQADGALADDESPQPKEELTSSGCDLGVGAADGGWLVLATLLLRRRRASKRASQASKRAPPAGAQRAKSA